MSVPSATLSQDLASSLSGVNLKWTLAGLATIKELSLIYFKNSSDADIVSMDIASGLVRNNLPFPILYLDRHTVFSFRLLMYPTIWSSRTLLF